MKKGHGMEWAWSDMQSTGNERRLARDIRVGFPSLFPAVPVPPIVACRLLPPPHPEGGERTEWREEGCDFWGGAGCCLRAEMRRRAASVVGRNFAMKTTRARSPRNGNGYAERLERERSERAREGDRSAENEKGEAHKLAESRRKKEPRPKPMIWRQRGSDDESARESEREREKRRRDRDAGGSPSGPPAGVRAVGGAFWRERMGARPQRPQCFNQHRKMGAPKHGEYSESHAVRVAAGSNGVGVSRDTRTKSARSRAWNAHEPGRRWKVPRDTGTSEASRRTPCAWVNAG
jgi:hypothetical protein